MKYMNPARTKKYTLFSSDATNTVARIKLNKTNERPCKTVPQCESQNHATLTPNIGSLKKKLSSCCVPKYLGLPFLTKNFVKIF